MVIKLRYKIIITVFLSIFVVTILFVSIKSNAALTTVPFKEKSIYLPIVMYHEVKLYKTGKDVITPEEFESDLKYLSLNHYTTISMTQLIDYVEKNTALPQNSIILSFDDGYLNNYEYVWPLLKKYKMKIVLSVIGKNTDDFTRVPDENLDYSHVTWDQLSQMYHSGYVEIQNHTYNLHSITKDRTGCMQKSGESLDHYEQVMKDDIGMLQEKILLLTGELPNTFTYPYGRSSKHTDLILKKLGFKASLSCKFGLNVITKKPENLFGLKRICRSHEQSLEKMIKKATETLKFIKD